MAEKTSLLPESPDRAASWLKGRERPILLAAAGLQLVVLAAILVIHALPLWVGEPILLRVAPVDPRDLFRGDFVILDYDIARVGWVEGLSEKSFFREDTPVYVTLEREPDGEHWRAVRASLQRPSGVTYIKGRYAQGRLRFGIEAYYVQEGTGLQYEQAIRDRRLSAEVALTSWGQATLRGLKLGERREAPR
jgi:uncharacterized membrane-anchored protein